MNDEYKRGYREGYRDGRNDKPMVWQFKPIPKPACYCPVCGIDLNKANLFCCRNNMCPFTLKKVW